MRARERGKEIDIQYTLAKFIYSAHDVAIENNRRKERECALAINFPFSHKKSTKNLNTSRDHKLPFIEEENLTKKKQNVS